ncbi:MAG: nickel-dependent lactate racemase [Promethearchaeota archaeon]
MNQIQFDYGTKGLEIHLHLDWNTTIIRAKKQEIFKNPLELIKDWINNPIGTMPLREILKQKKKIKQVCIVVSDATRPVPSQIILKAIIAELNEYGITDDKILILIATGLHRTSYENEIDRILGDNLKKRVRYVDHNAKDKKILIFLGQTKDDTPIFINKRYLDSDLKILTGYVEPHFFFGFSGGKKSIVPGIAGIETIQANHSPNNIDSQYARFGIYKDNPMAKNSTEIAHLAGVDFMVNVCINENHEITQVAAGDLEEVHKRLVNYQLNYIFEELDNPFDIVICGNGGYPLDLNLYQAVKSMAIGEIAVKEGGTIISVNECIDGIGKGHEKFKELLFSNKEPSELYNEILNSDIEILDQWEIQILARIMMKAEIYVVSTLKETELGNIGLKYAKSVESAIKSSLLKHGKNAKILILPNGPQIIPKLKNS